MSALMPKVGEIFNVTTFTHTTGDMQVSFKRPGRKQTYVFLYLGVETEGDDPLDLEGVIKMLGRKPPSAGQRGPLVR